MALQVLPPGVTSLTARTTPDFSGPKFVGDFAAEALSKDPRSIIAGADAGALRIWVKSILGNSWREDLSLDDLARQNPRILYKAACLYLQGRYWGRLPDDYSGPSEQFNPQGCQQQMGDKTCVNPAFGWPVKSSVLEQRIFTWQVNFAPLAAPAYLQDDVNGAIYMPIITPTMLIQKFDEQKQVWRVLNTGGMDRNFSLSAPGGVWSMRGWDFGEWFASNADFATVLKVVGFAVVAVAAAVSGGAALIAGAPLFGAIGAGAAAAQTAGQIFEAAKVWLVACVNQDFGGALTALKNLVGVTFNVNLADVAVYQPGIDQLTQALGPYLAAVKGLGGDTAGDVYDLFLHAGRDAAAFATKTEKLVAQINTDTVQKLFGMFPDQFVQYALKQSTSELGVTLDKIRGDYTARAAAAVKAIESQVPQYLTDWKTRGISFVKQIGHEQASGLSTTQPWYGRAAYDAGTAIGAIQQRLTQTAIIDINALTSPQKRALFFGEVVQICGADPSCIQNAGEYLRQADLLWNKLQYYVDFYKLGG